MILNSDICCLQNEFVLEGRLEVFVVVVMLIPGLEYADHNSKKVFFEYWCLCHLVSEIKNFKISSHMYIPVRKVPMPYYVICILQILENAFKI